jgi:hypothetical protein
MTPEAVLFAIQGLIRVGLAARQAFEQKVRDAKFPMPNVTLPHFDTSDLLYEFFTRQENRKLIETDGPLADAWKHKAAGLGLPREDPESRRRLMAAYFSIAEARRTKRGGEKDFGKQRLIEEQGAYVLLSQWGKSQGPPDPMVRIALSMADVVLEYIGSTPAIFGVGGNGEKFVAALSMNLRQLLPDPDRIGHWAEGEWAEFYFAERTITIFLRAGFKTIGEHSGLVVEERHYRELAKNVALPLLAGFAKDPATRPSWVELRDTFFGPVAEAAMTILAEHQSAFLSERFDATKWVGAVTQALFLEIAKGEVRKVFEKAGLVRLYQAALGAAVERPELFVKEDGNPDVQLARRLLSQMAEELRDVPAPFDKGLVVEVAAAAIGAVSEHGPALLLDQRGAWEQLAGKVARSVVDGIAWGRGAGDLPQGIDRLLSREQILELARVFLDQASKTPGMFTGGGSGEEVKTLAAVITSAMCQRGAFLLSSEEWLAVAGAAAAEVARNPGRLFDGKADDPGHELAARAIRIALCAAADSFDEQGRSGGAVLFGKTLLAAVEYMLQAMAGASEKALKNLDAVDGLIRRLNGLVKVHAGRVGSQQWLTLFTRLFSQALDGKAFSDVPDDKLLEMLRT